MKLFSYVFPKVTANISGTIYTNTGGSNQVSNISVSGNQLLFGFPSMWREDKKKRKERERERAKERKKKEKNKKRKKKRI